MRSIQTLQVGAVLAALAVALGAFAAHGLEGRLTPEHLATFETAARYQMYAALTLLALGTQSGQRRAPAVLLAGSVIFSGSLYLLALSGISVLGAVAPVGGLLLIAGFVLAAIDAGKGG
ncbi:DUF423 domain-containing protein [Deinococcus sp. HMF7604]|uniref:DUF423 domain-containing protein n=1 Tax=Deinococcus betulae TaxID=2873312 RepID=UPI001CCBB7E3|nr:DUF423 domain-containing protein [Deinococcus betulae]MBZ9751383.1 DUF423 domain-containing protein [Deinococcus betulae]